MSIIGKVNKLFVLCVIYYIFVVICCYISLVCFVFIIGIFLNENFKYMILKGSLRVKYEYNFIDFNNCKMICLNKYNLYVRL